MRTEVPTYSRIETLHQDAGASLVLYRCPGTDTAPRAEERGPDRHQFVFVRSGSFLYRSRRGPTVADANQVVFFNRGEPYRVQHPEPTGDVCLTLWVPDADRRAWMGDWTEPVDGPLPWKSGLSTPEAALEAHRLEVDARRGIDHDERHERAVGLLAGVRPIAPLPLRRTRARRRDATEVAEDVKALLGRRLSTPLPLAAIAGEIGLSVFALCRLFRSQTGTSIHRYRRRLRLREGLRRLAEGALDITGLALDLGFAEHSHFTNAFRDEFGLAPSAFRRLFRTAPPPTPLRNLRGASR